MGQEIVHCSVCGLRLRGVDFGTGAARLDGSAYCRECARELNIPPDPPKPPDAGGRSSDKSTGRIPVVAPPAGGGSSRNTTRRMAAVTSTSTARIPLPTPRRGTEVVPARGLPPALLWGFLFGVAGALIAAAVFLGGRSRRSDEPEPEVVRPAATVGPRDPAVALREPASAPQKPADKATEATDLAALERRVAECLAGERYREALDHIESQRGRHDSLEWTAAIQRTVYRVNVAAKKMPDAPPAPPPVAEPVAASPGAAPAAVPAPAPPSAAPPPARKSAPVPFVAGVMKWSVLTPLRATSSQSTPLAILEDGSILAEGAVPAQDRYTVALRTDARLIHSLRLELLPDPSLGGSGPGRAENGNIVLTEFQVQVLPDAQASAGSPVVLERAAADHEQIGFPITAAIDGRNDTGWALWPQLGRAHDGIFDLRSPISSASPVTLLVVLDHQSIHVQHIVGRFRLSCSAIKGASSEISSRPPPAVDPGPVDAAIAKGVEWLHRAGSPGHEFPPERKIGPIRNCDDLLLLTFIHSGVPESDPRFQQLLASVLAAPFEHTYPVAIRAMALEELDRVRYQGHIARCAQFLLDNQLASGQWTYGEPSVTVDTVRVEVPAASTAPRAPSTSPRTKPKVVQRISVRPTRTPAGNGDFSNSQYAALGLRACVDAGILIPKDVLSRAAQAVLVAQIAPGSKDPVASLASGRKPRGWCYDYPCGCPLHRAYGSMTAGGVSTMAIYDHLLGRDAKKDAAILDGLAWLQVNYAIDTVPGPIEFDKISKNTFLPYYLYGLERAMILTGNERVGPHPWYADGVRYLLQTQRPDGSWAIDDWGRDTWDTCFALLFLKRSTRPLVASTDDKK